MSMNSFELHNPTSVAEALALLDKQHVYERRTQVLAGGQDLLTELKDRLVEPEEVVNLKYIPGLDKLTWDARNGLQIGALVKVSEVAESAEVLKRFPALAQAAGSVASPQIRHMGTMGGNLCQRPRCWYYRNENIVCLKKGGDRCYAVAGENKYNAILGGGPSFIVHPSDTATALVALGATVTIAGLKGSRTIPLEKFFALPKVNVRRENILLPNEILTGITVPNSPLAARSVYLKFREKTSMDWAMSAAAVALHVSNGRVADCRIALGGVAPIPWRVPKAEAALKGKAVNAQILHAVAEIALEDALALQQNGYKVPLTKTLLRRAIQQAIA
ncbi:MAG TPA: xanthine dehydrogenase family protein subunit M [Chthonomonadaceae bacterium]|nr:xanthine dehydrogenase family protein subunit M [Chthonomonadaceae bacterium]